MARAREREMSVEEFEDWCEARREVEDISAAADEEGGPRLSYLPDPTTAGQPGGPDWIGGDQAEPKLPAVPFEPESSRNRLSGWSAARQKFFIEALAETGTVHLAAKRAGLSARSAYQLRLRSPAFAQAWNAAQQLAVGRLSALAFDRAIHGRLEQVYQNGELVGERRVPSERLLMWLLARLDPRRFAMPWERRGDEGADPQGDAAAAFSDLVAALTDTPEFTQKVERLTTPELDAGDEPSSAGAECAAPAIASPTSDPAPDPATSAKIGKIGPLSGASLLTLVRSLDTGEGLPPDADDHDCHAATHARALAATEGRSNRRSRRRTPSAPG